MAADPNRARLVYVINGNQHAPRAKLVRVYTHEGPKDLVVGAQKISALVETIIACGPSRLEAYEDDKGTRMLRAVDFQQLDGEGDAAAVEEQQQLAVSREERLLSHFASLLAKAYEDSHTAFKQLVRIAEHHASRASAAERSVATLHAATIKQTQAMLRMQAKQMEDAGDESGGVDKLLTVFQQAKEMGAAERTAHTNGVNGAGKGGAT